MDRSTIIKRLELIKDSDPFNKRILNDCYEIINNLYDRIDTLEQTLENVYESVGTEQKL